MIDAKLLRDDGILVISPQDELEAVDFERLHLLDAPYVEKHGALKGMLIDAESFSGWEDFAGMLSQIRLLRNYEDDFARVAAVSDNGFLAILPKVADLFASADVRHFSYPGRDRALAWLRTGRD